ncbi:SDR family NAD(P)-dependent oxidoreductase [Steroidobacter cummioxidans]|uniref:SDR family NAD(P)-dependent oxidoreductase n=1 Tax=Steroidobacter cummioxidans TaxID=1803913 RepID=UPI000E31F0E6|nr:SDR family NAD(P)-dependent oxidoreductase [Steroidobacter cummioxidans]
MDRRTFIHQAALAGIAAQLPCSANADTPHSQFNRNSTAEQVTAGLNLAGKTAVVTGCNSGIGFETMRVLALRGAHVIGTARTLDKGKEACGKISGKTTPVVLELTDFDSVVACANTIRNMNVSIDMLILNAGIILDDWQQVNGIEKQFVVNHLGHFILTQRLLDRVISAEQGRVVVVGSGNHRDAPQGGIQFNDLSGRNWYRRGYAHSKLANGLYSLELSQRLSKTRATSNCLSPGPVDTNIRRDLPASATPANLKSPAQGAATVCYVAAHPTLKQVNGEYFSDCNPAPQSAHQTDRAMSAKLWQVSTELTRHHLT